VSNRRERTGLIPVGRWFNLALQRQTRKAPIKNRPTSVTVFGILNIVFAGFSLFAVFATITLFSMEVSSNNPVVKLLHENRALAFWLRVSILLGLVNCLVLVVSGLGLLFVKPWARVLAIAYGGLRDRRRSV